MEDVSHVAIDTEAWLDVYNPVYTSGLINKLTGGGGQGRMSEKDLGIVIMWVLA